MVHGIKWLIHNCDFEIKKEVLIYRTSKLGSLVSKHAEANMESPGKHQQISWDGLGLLKLPVCFRSFPQPVLLLGFVTFP